MKKYAALLVLILAMGAALTSLDEGAGWLKGWLAYSTLLGGSAAGLVWLFHHFQPVRSARAAAWTAMLLRLCIGLALMLLLPQVGYADNLEHQAGYAFTDAYNRDNQAWELAGSDQPLARAFSGDYPSDQYGGLLALSAFLYRYLSPDHHRQLLMVILNAAASAWGVLLVWKSAGEWFGDKAGKLAGWIFALYPESILLGASQMREGLVIPAVALTLYIVLLLQRGKRQWLAWMAGAALILFPIQPLAGFVAFGVALGVWLGDPARLAGGRRARLLLTGLVAAAGLGVILLVAGSVLANLPSLQGRGPLGVFAAWFQNNFQFQSYITERASGMFQKLLDSAGEQWRWLIVLVYGIAQPVLPAVVGDPDAVFIVRIIGFMRAAGWYPLAPLLVYGSLGALRLKREARKLQLLWISLVTWGWIAISALNAGGDQWDNPRYRAILLVWQALLAAWAWSWARQRKDAWLGRWVAVEAVFVVLFTQWYLGRVYPNILHLDIFVMIAITLALAGLILLGGWAWDRWRAKA